MLQRVYTTMAQANSLCYDGTGNQRSRMLQGAYTLELEELTLLTI